MHSYRDMDLAPVIQCVGSSHSAHASPSPSNILRSSEGHSFWTRTQYYGVVYGPKDECLTEAVYDLLHTIHLSKISPLPPRCLIFQNRHAQLSRIGPSVHSYAHKWMSGKVSKRPSNDSHQSIITPFSEVFFYTSKCLLPSLYCLWFNSKAVIFLYVPNGMKSLRTKIHGQK